MKKILLMALMVGWCGVVQAQCVAEIKDVKLDEERGSIIVETKYILNGVVVTENGRNRFTNISGEDDSIIEQAKEGISVHCNNLIKRIEGNELFIINEKKKRLKTFSKVLRP